MLARKIAIASLGVVIAAYASFAAARGSSPLNGMEYIASERTCFSYAWNMLTQSCTGNPRGWTIDATVDTGDNYHYVQLWGRGNGTAKVQCTAQSSTANGATGWAASMERTSATWGQMTPTNLTVWVPSQGVLRADCSIPQNGGVSAFHYLP
jgi:hypothetical protein